MRGPRLPHLPPGRRGSGAPPPARVAGPPHPAVSQHRERRPSGGRGRTAVKDGPHGSAPRRAPKAREMRCSEAEAPNAQRRANRGGGRHGIPRKAAPIRGLGPPRGPPGAGGAAGRGRAVCGEAGPRLEFGLLWRGGRPARASCRAASPRGPRPSPGNSLRSCGGGRVLSHQTRWTPRPGLPDAARRRLRGVWLPDGQPGSHSGASASPPRPLRRRPLGPNAKCQVQRISCGVTTTKGPSGRTEDPGAAPAQRESRRCALAHRLAPVSAARDAGLSLRRGHSPRLPSTLRFFWESDRFLNTRFALLPGVPKCSH